MIQNLSNNYDHIPSPASFKLEEMTVIWNMTSCNLVDEWQLFGGTSIYQNTRRHNPESRNVDNYCRILTRTDLTFAMADMFQLRIHWAEVQLCLVHAS